jgi:hypothetical protein
MGYQKDAAWWPKTGLPQTPKVVQFNLSLVASTEGERVFFPDDSSVNGQQVVLVRSFLPNQLTLLDSLGVTAVLTLQQQKNVYLYLVDASGDYVIEDVSLARFNDAGVWALPFFRPFRIDLERSYITTWDASLVNKELFAPIQFGYL